MSYLVRLSHTDELGNAYTDSYLVTADGIASATAAAFAMARQMGRTVRHVREATALA